MYKPIPENDSIKSAMTEDIGGRFWLKNGDVLGKVHIVGPKQTKTNYIIIRFHAMVDKVLKKTMVAAQVNQFQLELISSMFQNGREHTESYLKKFSCALTRDSSYIEEVGKCVTYNLYFHNLSLSFYTSAIDTDAADLMKDKPGYNITKTYF